jgi:hypothetical protein
MKSTNWRLLTRGIAACAIWLALLPSAAQAEYKYVYTSQPIPVTWTALFDDTLPPSVIDTTLTAVIFSPTLLVAGSGLTSGLSFTLKQSAPFSFEETLVYPYPYEPVSSSCGPGTPCHPFDDGVFSIGAVDAAGLPTQWNVGINFAFQAPTGRSYSRNFLTSTNLDSISGGYEGFSQIEGSLANSPGSWTVSAVPEPESYAMLFAGLGLIGFAVRRRKSLLVTQAAR